MAKSSASPWLASRILCALVAALLGCQAPAAEAPPAEPAVLSFPSITEAAAPVQALDAKPATVDVLAQAAIGSMACGPCALYNSLLGGTLEHRLAASQLQGAGHEQRVRSLIAGWAQAPSETYGPRRSRYDAKEGMPRYDMLHFASEYLAEHKLPPVAGHWLDRRPQEDQEQHLRRVHARLSDSSLPAVIELRSFHADDKANGPPLWEGLFGHWLSVRAVDPLPEGPVSGFLMRCADSVNGREIPIFVRLERHRAFIATKEFQVGPDGKERWDWVRNQPYLLVTAPDLALRTQVADWNERSTIALTFAIADAEPRTEAGSRKP